MSNNQDSLKQLCKTRSRELYIQEWQLAKDHCPKLDLYNKFKTVFRAELYLNAITNYKVRVSLTRLRITAHNLAIETGRYDGRERQERICNKCDLNEVEDEYHFVMKCTLYRDFRHIYINEYFIVNPSIDKFVALLSSTNKNVIQQLGRFVNIALKL